MAWHCKEIHELCDKKSLFYPASYLKSLDWMNWKIEYHAQQAQKVWDEFKSAHPGSREIGGNEQWWNTYFASAAETEAVVQSLNPQADVVAQVVNQLVLRGYFPKGKERVTFCGVLKKLENLHGSASDVAVRMRALKDSKEFKYINAFCNTIKHIELIRKQWHVEGGNGTRNKEDVRFLAFSYNGSPFPITWASDINGPYRKTLGRFVGEIGNVIIDYLRLNP